jgi:acetyl esterase/lipase
MWLLRNGTFGATAPVCRVGDSTGANNSAASAANVRKPAQLLYDANEGL